MYYFTARSLLSLPLLIWSSINTCLQYLILALILVFKLILEILALAYALICDRPLARLQGLRRGLLVVFCCALGHLCLQTRDTLNAIAQDALFQA